MTGDETPVGDHPDPRRRRAIAAVLGAVAVVLVVGWIVLARDDDGATTAAGDASSTSTAEATSGDAGAGDGATPSTTVGVSGGETRSDGGEADSGTDVSIPVGAIEGTGEAQVCAAILERLREYRQLAEQGTVDPDVVDALDEFSDEIFTLADDQDWGDRIIENLTAVRRDWATAASGDTERAAQDRQRVVEGLDTTIDRADCPTA